MESTIKETFNQHGFPLTAHQAAQFELYRDELLRWNERFNLTAITDKVEITHKHFLDSLGVLKHIALESSDTVIDIGTGAGFPGIVLKIYVPDIRLTLVEASKKKGSFLRFLISKLNLHRKADVEVLTERAEVCVQDLNHIGAYDWVFTRYVATIRNSAAYCIPFLKPTGKWVAYKSGKEIIDREISESAVSLKALGGDVETVFTTRVFNRSYVIIQKT
ncbi:16S rRNA (guanine(527)-N(7))-methyltransferase RsmG [Candidatus Poribacteria bacterium]|nr:16S rRNA (guanine(527)-N(7))-methyltransferase RsmG [Candidatus Poribacteria bacterium]